MNLPKKRLTWRRIFVLCCLVYLPWVLYQSRDNFDMVHRHYRKANEHLQPAMIEKTATYELASQCRMTRPDGECPSTWPAAELAAQREKVKTRLVDQRSRAQKKLVLFYVFFIAIFCILPPLVLYPLLALAFWFLKSLKKPES